MTEGFGEFYGAGTWEISLSQQVWNVVLQALEVKGCKCVIGPPVSQTDCNACIDHSRL